jgi:predicted GIY-YIG superfamily endonuclease
MYILRCRDGSYYIGHTDDLTARLSKHQKGLVEGHTKNRRPVRLVYSEEHPERQSAFLRERQVKRMVAGKEGSAHQGKHQAPATVV